MTGCSDPENVDVTELVEYSGKIYAGVTNQVNGVQIWSSFTGDNNTWTRVSPAVPGTELASVTGFVDFDGALYAAVESNTPVQIWRTYGGVWETIVSNGFGNSQTRFTGGMAVFEGYLYIGAGNITDGAHLWRTTNGTSWEQAIPPGFGDANNQKVEMVFVFRNQLFVSVKNTQTGIEIWRSPDGNTWEPVNQDDFGDIHNHSTNWRNATAVFQNQLYVGTLNIVDAGELWRFGGQTMDAYLPLILR